MKKKVRMIKSPLAYSLLLLLVIFLTACSEDEEIKPEDRFVDYVDHWHEQDFDAMYQLISASSQEDYSTEDFIDRYQKIYQDLEITDLIISYQLPDDEDQAEPSTVFPIEVTKNSIAGEITFTSEIILVEQINEEDEQSDWFIEWQPGLIFPALREGAEIAVERSEPARGEIFDRNGNGLAVNEIVYNVGVQPGLFDDRETEMEELATLLEMDIASIERELSAGWVTDDVFVPLKKVPTHDQELIDQIFSLPSVIKQDVTARAYPYEEAMAHVIGYTSGITAEELEQQEPGTYHQNDVIGKRGLEQLFESRLRGTRGTRIIAVSENSRTTIAEQEAVDGEDITVTLDADIQTELFNSYEEDAGTAVAINPKTGETLALVSSPAFNPHTFAYGISQTNWQALQEDEQNPLLNRFAATFSPGSTIKPITGAIGLTNDGINLDEGIEINGLTWAKEGWGNYEVRRVSESSGPVDLRDALVRSDNIYFAQKMVELGQEAFVTGLEAFGFGDTLPFTYPIPASTVSNDGSIDRDILLADSAYGQGEILMSALHLAVAYTPFLNNGAMIQPVLEVNEPTGTFIADGLVETEHASYIREALRQAVIAPNGTARAANSDSVDLAGKTGTAELKQSLTDEGAQENGWFVAYPSEEDILVAMMVEHVQDKGGSGYVAGKTASFFERIR